jgi:PAS domain S-box-containing protein
VVFVQDITSRKQAEMKLRQFSRIVEQAPLSIAIANLEGTIEYANPTFCAVSGYTLPELLGQNPRVLKSGLTAPNVFADMWATLRRGEVWRGELTNKKKDGQLYDELAVISPVTDEQGKPTHYVALKQDITARKAGENALRDSEARFRELFDLETDAIMVTDTETGRFLQVNEAAAATYGYSVDEMLNLDSAVITAEPEKTRELYKALRQNADQAIEVPVRLHRKRDGTVFPVDIKIRSFVRNGRQIHVSVNRDITAQIKAREQLERFNVELENKVALRTEEIAARNHEIEALLRSIPDMVMRMRRDGTVLNFQPAKGETPLARVAMTSTVMANQSSHSLKPLMNAAFPLGLRAVAEKTAVAVETEIAFGSASLTAELRVAPIGTEEFVVFARDITERKRFEAAMVAMLDKERQMSEMKTRFISVTSHEFRTPMAAAMASAELLHNHPDRITPAKREELFVRIAVSFRRMMEMLDDVLLLNRMDADKVDVKLCSIDVKKSIQSYIDEIRLGDKDAHHFEFHSIGDTTHFATDPNLLHHILANLLSNAVRYSLPGTVVTTRLTAEPGKMRIMVEDQGIGIPEEDRARIFESFERGSNVGTIKGTGLGLNIVKRMTGLLGGTIEVDAIEGGGSRFTVTFPRA